MFAILFDRVFGTHFFLAGAAATSGTGDPILFQHVFWIFGHPEVYILILTCLGYCFRSIVILFSKACFWSKGNSAFNDSYHNSFYTCLWTSHVYNFDESITNSDFYDVDDDNLNSLNGFFFNWLGTIWRGSISFQSPMLFSLGVVFVFGLRWSYRLHLGTVTTDLYLHDTYFVVGHFHYTMAASVLLGGFAGIYFWMPKMFGVMMNETLAKVHFWITMLGLKWSVFWHANSWIWWDAQKILQSILV